MPAGNKIIFFGTQDSPRKVGRPKKSKERAEIQGDMIDFLSPVLWKKEVAEQMILRAKPKLKKDADKLAKQTRLLLRMHNLCVKH